jgi:hypothetical protein
MTEKLIDLRTPSGNTGFNSQNGYESGIDWLDLMVRSLTDRNDAVEFLSLFSKLIDDDLQLPDGPGRFCGERWKYSGTSAGGVVIDYAPPLAEPFYPCEQFPDWKIRQRRWQSLLPRSDQPFSQAYVDTLPTETDDGFYLDIPSKKSCSLSGVMFHDVLNNDPKNYGYSYQKRESKRIIKAGKMRISLPGRALQRIELRPLLDFLNVMKDSYKIECTRLDGMLDDKCRTTKREDLFEAISLGNYAGVETATPYEPRKAGVVTGFTHYFGSNKSDGMLRVYDKKYESKGENLSIRWELQLRRGKAQSAFETILAFAAKSPDYIATYIASIVVGHVSFIDRSTGDKNLSRCSLLPWYADFIKATVQPIKLSAAKKTTTIQKKVMFFGKQCPKSLAMMAATFGLPKLLGFVGDLVSEGISKLTAQDRFVIADTDVDLLAIDRDDRRNYEQAMKMRLAPMPPPFVPDGGLMCT